MAKILLIDDDDQLRAVLRRVLKNAGYDVADAENGKIGLAMFAGDQPDMVITDLVMPDQEGIETIRALRSDHPDLPILAISGGATGGKAGGNLAFASLLGANRTLAKPFPNADLLEVVRCLLGDGATPLDASP